VSGKYFIMREKQIHKGDRVKFTLGTRLVQGVVTEDRGPIGVKGRHLYLIEFSADPLSPHQIELPAEDVQLVRRPPAPKRRIIAR
jgi:hypothetical protein